MKKIVLGLSLFATFFASAQQHEVKVDLLDILALKSLDVAYEHALNDEASLGLSVFINFEDKDKDFRYNEGFQLIPYFRQNFKQIGSFDLFGEVFGSLNFGENEVKNDAGEKVDEDYTDFALGLGAGLKRVSSNGYVLEANIGIGRNLFNSDKSHAVVPRFGLSIGKQF